MVLRVGLERINSRTSLYRVIYHLIWYIYSEYRFIEFRSTMNIEQFNERVAKEQNKFDDLLRQWALLQTQE